MELLAQYKTKQRKSAWSTFKTRAVMQGVGTQALRNFPTQLVLPPRASLEDQLKNEKMR